MGQAEAVSLGLHAVWQNGRRRPLHRTETIEITIVKHNAALGGFNQWTLNGEAFSMETMKPMYTVRKGAPLPTEISQRQRRHPSAASTPS